MASNHQIETSSRRRNQLTPLSVFLMAIMAFFCAILVFVYAATRHANPVMLDQQGRPLKQSLHDEK